MKVIWNPQGYGRPDLPGTRPRRTTRATVRRRRRQRPLRHPRQGRVGRRTSASTRRTRRSRTPSRVGPVGDRRPGVHPADGARSCARTGASSSLVFNGGRGVDVRPRAASRRAAPPTARRSAAGLIDSRPVPLQYERPSPDVSLAQSRAFLASLDAGARSGVSRPSPCRGSWSRTRSAPPATAPSGANRQPWPFVVVCDPESEGATSRRPPRRRNASSTTPGARGVARRARAARHRLATSRSSTDAPCAHRGLPAAVALARTGERQELLRAGVGRHRRRLAAHRAPYAPASRR